MKLDPQNLFVPVNVQSICLVVINAQVLVENVLAVKTIVPAKSYAIEPCFAVIDALSHVMEALDVNLVRIYAIFAAHIAIVPKNARKFVRLVWSHAYGRVSIKENVSCHAVLPVLDYHAT